MRLSKYARSQRAHDKLVAVNMQKADKALPNMRKRQHYLNLRNYHADVYYAQQRERKVLSLSQRRKIYKAWFK